MAGFVKYQKGKAKPSTLVVCIKCQGQFPADTIEEHQATCKGKAA